jgi:hypothetical protein
VFRAVPEVFRAVLGCSVRSGGVPGSSGLVFRVLVHAEQISRVLIGWAVVPSWFGNFPRTIGTRRSPWLLWDFPSNSNPIMWFSIVS